MRIWVVTTVIGFHFFVVLFVVVAIFLSSVYLNPIPNNVRLIAAPTKTHLYTIKLSRIIIAIYIVRFSSQTANTIEWLTSLLYLFCQMYKHTMYACMYIDKNGVQFQNFEDVFNVTIFVDSVIFPSYLFWASHLPAFSLSRFCVYLINCAFFVYPFSSLTLPPPRLLDWQVELWFAIVQFFCVCARASACVCVCVCLCLCIYMVDDTACIHKLVMRSIAANTTNINTYTHTHTHTYSHIRVIIKCSSFVVVRLLNLVV